MEIFDAIEKRHSYRGGFTGKPVSREDLEKIVQAGIQAPSGCNEQTTTFVIVDRHDLIASVADVLDKKVVHEAGALIVCVVDKRPVINNWSFAAEDCAAAVENILLAITALGYATVWLQGALYAEQRSEQIARILEVPDNLEVRVVLPIGEPTETAQQKEKLPFDSRAWFNGYGGPKND